MLRALTKRPSIAIAIWASLVLLLFVLRGDLRVQPRSQAPTDAVLRQQRSTAIVRRTANRSPFPRDAVVRRGRVLDTLGYSLVGVEVVPERGEPSRTDAEGAFRVGLQRGRCNDLLLRGEGWRPRWRRTCLGEPDPLVLRLEPSAPWDAAPAPLIQAPTLRGEGVVVGGEGKPVPLAYVHVLGTQIWGQADDIGRVELPLPARAMKFFLAHSRGDGRQSFAGVSASFAPSRDRGIVPLPQLQLLDERACMLRGTLRDPDGVPIAGVPVEVRGAGMRRRVETGAGGAFRLASVLRGDYEVEPFACRGAVGEVAAVRVDRAIVDCDVQLVAVREQRVQVVDEAGQAASNVWVAAASNGWRRGLAQADESGFVSLPVPPRPEFDVRIGESFEARPVRRFADDREPATLVIAIQ